MQRYGTFKALLGRRLATSQTLASGHISPCERLFLVGSISTIGVAGWNQRRLNANTAAFEYVQVLEAPAEVNGAGGSGPRRAERSTSSDREPGRACGSSSGELGKGQPQAQEGVDKDVAQCGQPAESRGAESRGRQFGSAAVGLTGSVGGQRSGGLRGVHSAGSILGGPGEGERANQEKRDASANEGQAKLSSPPRIRRLLVDLKRTAALDSCQALRGTIGPPRKQDAVSVFEDPCANKDPTKLPLRVRKFVTNIEKTAELDRREASIFREIVSRASASRERDGRWPRSHQPRMPLEPQDFEPSFFQAGAWREHQKADEQKRRLEIHAERHPYKLGWSDAKWLGLVLEMLNESTPTDLREMRKVLETVRLPEGLRAVFKDGVGEAILGVFQRTGSHLQIAPMKSTRFPRVPDKRKSNVLKQFWKYGFERLTLYGTRRENSAAMELLPELVFAVNKDRMQASQDLSDYDLEWTEVEQSGSVAEGAEGSEDAVSASEAPSVDPSSHRTSADGNGTKDYSDNNALFSPKLSNELDDEEMFWITDVDKDDGAQQAPIRAYWITQRRSIHTLVDLSAREDGLEGGMVGLRGVKFRRPLRWTTLSFTDYVDTLTHMPPRLLRRHLVATMSSGTIPAKNEDRDEQQQVAAAQNLRRHILDELVSVFADPRAAPAVSQEAVNLAFRFLCRHTEFADVRSILASLEKHTFEKRSDYRLTTDNFDILLLAAARNEDPHNFRMLLRTMVTKGCNPSWRTWANLHLLVCRRYGGTSAPARVLAVIEERGMLQLPQMLTHVVANRVALDLRAFLASRGDEAKLMEFVRAYDERFQRRLTSEDEVDVEDHSGRAWLSTMAANAMCRVLLLHGRAEDARTVVTMLRASGQKDVTGTLNEFLTAAVRATDPELALESLKFFAVGSEDAAADPGSRSSSKVQLDEVSWDLLFKTAWRWQGFNVLRVVWRYACCAGHLDQGLRRRIMTSLVNYVPAPEAKNHREARGEREIARAALKGSDRLKALTEGADGDGIRMLDDWRVFHGWAGKMAVGVGDHILPSQLREPELEEDEFGFEETDSGYASAEEQSVVDEASRDKTKPSDDNRLAAAMHKRLGDEPEAGDEITTPSPFLTEQEAEIHQLALQFRSKGEPNQQVHSEAAVDVHHQRQDRLMKIFLADLGEAGSLRPTVPLMDMLDQAWQKDMRWKARGLGLWSEHLEAVVKKENNGQEEAEDFGKVFKEMLEQAIRVPVVVGDAVAARRRYQWR